MDKIHNNESRMFVTAANTGEPRQRKLNAIVSPQERAAMSAQFAWLSAKNGEVSMCPATSLSLKGGVGGSSGSPALGGPLRHPSALATEAYQTRCAASPHRIDASQGSHPMGSLQLAESPGPWQSPGPMASPQPKELPTPWGRHNGPSDPHAANLGHWTTSARAKGPPGAISHKVARAHGVVGARKVGVSR